MKKRVFIIIFCFLFLALGNPVYSKEYSQKSLNKYVEKISNKFSRTYCNAIKFGISEEGAIAFAIGETKKEFKNNQMNDSINYSLLRENILNNLEISCQAYNFPLDNLNNLKIS